MYCTSTLENKFNAQMQYFSNEGSNGEKLKSFGGPTFDRITNTYNLLLSKCIKSAFGSNLIV